MLSFAYQRLGRIGNAKALLTLWVGLSALPACSGISVLNEDASTVGGTSALEGASGGASSTAGAPVGGNSSTGGGPSSCDSGDGSLLGGKVCVDGCYDEGPRRKPRARSRS